MRKPRKIPLAVAILAIVATGVFSYLMARRIAAFNAREGRVVHVFKEIYEPQFTYADRSVRIEQAPPPQEGAFPSIEVEYGGASLSIPMTFPPNRFGQKLPGLRKYEDWLKVLRFAPLTGRTFKELVEAMDSGEERDRLVLVVRAIRPGTNPETWGRVWRKDWLFDFYEFMPDGSIAHERFAYPTARTAEDLAEPREQGGVPELDAQSWQFQAADLLMPEGSAPRIIAGDSPLVAAGWTFPAAIASVFAGTAALLIAFAPTRPRRARKPDADPSA